MIHKPQNRGAEMFACQLTNHLLKLGHEVKLVSVYKGNAILPYKGHITPLSSSLSNKVVDILAIRKLAEIIKKYQPDIIQANSGDTLKYSVLSKVFFRWKQPIVVRNASEVGKYLKTIFHQKINSFFYEHVERVVSVSKVSELDLINHFPAIKGKTEVIGVGIEQHEEIGNLILFPTNRKHIIHVGGFSFEKNHSGLLKIFKKILKKNSNIHLHLVGDGPLKEMIISQVKSSNLLDKVTFYGFITNPLDYIKSADVLILPSIIEGLPGVLLEAMYCKTPVVAYDVGGISEILNGKTGKLVPHENEDLFAEEVLNILQNKNYSQINTAYEMVKTQYLNETLASEFRDCYQRIIDSGRR